MSRSKIWGFTALVVAAGLSGVWVFTQRAASPAAEQVAATLRSGTLQFETGTRLLARQVRDVAAVAARDPALAGVLASSDPARSPRPPAQLPDVAVVAEAAVHAAAALLEVEMGRAPLVGSAFDRAVSLRVGERRFQARDALAQALLGSGAAPRHVRVDDAIYAVAVLHTERGLTLAFGLPIDPRWTERLQAATGADLTLVGQNLVSTLPPGPAAEVVAAARKAGGGVVEGGRAGSFSLGGGLPGFPLLFSRAPAFQARALSLSGIDGPVAVVSAPTRPALEPLAAFQQVMLAVILLLAVVGVGLGLVPEPVVPSHVPRELAAAADRISRGDFDVRVPRLSGTFGTLASALSRASEAARLGRITQGATGGLPAGGGASLTPVAPAPTLDVPLHAVSPEETTGSHRLTDPFSLGGMAPPVTPTPTPLPVRNGTPLNAAAAVQAAQALRAAMPRTTQPIPADPIPGSGRPTPAPNGEDGEGQWKAIYDEFLRVRSERGESVEGITWERFRDKLRKNRDGLVQKYACRTVRFQVYVKEGRAALRATPVR
jgi:hypothetical protein